MTDRISLTLVPASKPMLARKCVLIVEDNPLNMKLFSAMIAAQGHDVLQAMDGSHGIALAQSRCPDLIIMDIQLPDISGTDVTRALKSDEATRHIPILVTTAFDDEEKARESGCDAYMAKPIEVSAFLEMIEELITVNFRDELSKSGPRVEHDGTLGAVD